MAIVAQSADGVQHQFPDGTNPAVIDGVMKQYAAQMQAQAQGLTSSNGPQVSVPGKVDENGDASWSDLIGNIPSSAYKFGAGIASAVAHPAATLDNIKALADGEENKIRAAMGIAPIGQSAIDAPFASLPTYQQPTPSQNAQSAAMANAFNANMVSRYGSFQNARNTIINDPVGVAADVSSVLSPLGGGLRGATSKGSTLNEIGKAVQTAGDALNPANAVTKPISYAASQIPTNALTDALQKPFLARTNPDEVARQQVISIINRAGLTPQEAVAKLQAARADGQPMFTVADVLGDQGANALSTIARKPGDMRQTIVDTLLGRQAGQGDRLSRFVQSAFGVNNTADQTAANLTKARTDVANANYSAARSASQPVDVSNTLDNIDKAIGNPMAVADGANPEGVQGALLAARNSIIKAKMLSGDQKAAEFNSVLNVKQDLQDTVDALYRAGKGNQANALNAVVKSLDSDLANSSKAYRNANDSFAAMSRPIDAVDVGANAARPGTRFEDNVQSYNGLQAQTKPAFKADSYDVINTDPRPGFRAGYVDPIVAKIEAGAMGTNKARPLTSNKFQQESAVFAQNPDLLNRQIGRENTMFATNNRAMGGSLTADNLANDANFFENGGILDNMMKKGVVKGIASVALDKFKNWALGQNPEVQSRIAKILLQSNPQQFRAIINRQPATTNTLSALMPSMVPQNALSKFLLLSGQAGNAINNSR